MNTIIHEIILRETREISGDQQTNFEWDMFGKYDRDGEGTGKREWKIAVINPKRFLASPLLPYPLKHYSSFRTRFHARH